MLVPFSIRITAAITIPAMIVVKVSARRVPIAFEVAATFPVRLHPIGLREGRAAPVAVMPRPAPVDGIPIALDPLILRGGLRRDTIDPRWRGRRAKGEVERYLSVSRTCGKKQ
jgi:hypothetical protein